jgi:hypothetical protein
MRFRIILAVFLTCAVVTTSVEKSPPMNGFWWDETPDIAKTGFVIGYVAGIGHANKLLVEALEARKMSLTSADNDAPLESYMNFYEISFGQYREKLNEFYKDERNKRININEALLYVRDQIRGTPTSELQKRIESMRKAAMQPDYDGSF